MCNMNSGYSGYSMSNRAVDAYEDGEMPLSKWTKKNDNQRGSGTRTLHRGRTEEVS